MFEHKKGARGVVIMFSILFLFVNMLYYGTIRCDLSLFKIEVTQKATKSNFKYLNLVLDG